MEISNNVANALTSPATSMGSKIADIAKGDGSIFGGTLVNATPLLEKIVDIMGDIAGAVVQKPDINNLPTLKPGPCDGEETGGISGTIGKVLPDNPWVLDEKPDVPEMPDIANDI